MHADLPPGSAAPSPGNQPWWRELSRYHWFVLIVAALGWLFDTMDQQLFVLVRQPAVAELLDKPINDPEVREFGGYATTVFILGWATGGLVFGMFGDRWGRARTMLLTILIYSIFTGLSALSVSWVDFMVYRFLTGMGVGGEFAAGISLVAEVMPSRARPYALGLLQALSAIGNMTAALIYYAVFRLAPEEGIGEIATPWRLVFLVGILPALLVVFVRRKLKEPDSWLEARARQASGQALTDAGKQLGDMREMFSNPRWRYSTIIGVSLALVGVIGLWGVGFWTSELVRSFTPESERDFYVFLTSLLQNFGAFFGIYAASLIAGRFGRRGAFAVSFILAMSATVMVFGFMTESRQIWWMIPLLGFGSLMVFGCYAIYFPELYPTRLRSTGTGFCYNVARYLAAIAPTLLGLLQIAFLAPEGTERAKQGLSEFTLLSSLGGVDAAFRYAALSLTSVYLIGLLLLPLIPETKGKPLPE